VSKVVPFLATKAHRGAELQYLRSALDSFEWLASHLGSFTPATEQQTPLNNKRISGLQSRSGLFLEKTETFAFARFRTPDSRARRWPLHLTCHPGSLYASKLFTILIHKMGHAVAQLVEALCYKPKGRGFDSRRSHWNFSVT
jgi:hypothetical protein